MRKCWVLIGMVLAVLHGQNLHAQNPGFKGVKMLLEQGKNYTALQELNTAPFQKLGLYGQAQKDYLTAVAYNNEDREVEAFRFFLQSKKKFLQLDSLDRAMAINIDIAYLLSCQKNKFTDARRFLDQYTAYAERTGKAKLLAKAYEKTGSLIMDSDPQQSRKFFKKALIYNKSAKDTALAMTLYNNIGVLYNEILAQPDSALVYYRKALDLAKGKKDQNALANGLVNQAGCYYYLGDYQRSIALLRQADAVPIVKNVRNSKANIQSILSLNYEAAGNFRLAYDALKAADSLTAVQKKADNDLKISELQTKYETREKEAKNQFLQKKNVLLQNKERLSQTLLLTATALILVILVVSWLLIKNIAKKKKIAEQEKLIQTQKLENTLRNQELHDIDLMLETQEKERRRIADELHDNLGSMLATLKLNFQNLKRKTALPVSDESQLYDKTDELIDEAYQKVRNLSHLKNLGVIGNEGLLAAVRKMAGKMTVPGKLVFNVIPFGLNERLENAIEVAIFRMIQELCTNIIKHSGATEVNIYLTQNSAEALNLIIEDNGKGFDREAALAKEGIGLRNIEKKTEQMGGTFTIDSTPGRGTTIIIDIPL